MATTANYALRYPASSAPVTPYVDLQNLANDVDAIFARKGIVRRGSRATDSTATSAEIGVLRVDNIPILANYLYKIWTSPLFLIGSVTTDVNSVLLRTSSSGVATTASTQLCLAQDQTANTTHPPAISSLVMPYSSGSNQTLSVLLSVSRMAGGSGTVKIGAAVGTIELVIECLGLDPGDSGVDL
jgi:hypothetical protein